MAVKYEVNAQTGYYTQSENQPNKTAVIRLPNELKIESMPQEKEEQEPIILIVDVDSNQTDTVAFFIRLHKTAFYNWYVGNICEKVRRKKIKSLALFRFSEDENSLTVYYFPHYDKKNKRKAAVCNGCYTIPFKTCYCKQYSQKKSDQNYKLQLKGKIPSMQKVKN